MESARGALRYPFSNEQSRFKPYVALLVLLATSLLVVPLFPLFGYLLRTREASLRGDDEIPPFEDVVGLTKEGFFGLLSLGFVVAASYFGVAGLLFALASIQQLTRPIRFGIVYVVVATVIYSFPAVVSVYAARRRFRDLFTTRHVLDVATTKQYLVGVLVYYPTMLALYFTGYVLSAVVGALVLVAAPFVLLARNAFWGYVVRGTDADGDLLAA